MDENIKLIAKQLQTLRSLRENASKSFFSREISPLAVSYPDEDAHLDQVIFLHIFF
jgi:hypothetical protein